MGMAYRDDAFIVTQQAEVTRITDEDAVTEQTISHSK